MSRCLRDWWKENKDFHRTCLLVITGIAVTIAVCSWEEANKNRYPELVAPQVRLQELETTQGALEAKVASLSAVAETLLAEKDVADLVPPRYRALVMNTAERHGLDARLVASVAWVETGGTWDTNLVGTSGEVGLMQVLPSTAKWIASKKGEPVPNLSEPAVGLEYGSWYLGYLIKVTGDVDEALRQYNAGPAWERRAPTVARGYSRRVNEKMNE